jgi:hypothetical protein
VIVGNKGPSDIIIAKRIYFEIDNKGSKLIAIDWISAMGALYELDMGTDDFIDEE